MKPLLTFGYCLSLSVIAIFGCNKNQTDEERRASTPSGMVYMDCGSELRKINVVDSSLVWERGNSNLSGGAGCPMVLDSTGLYTGSTRALSAFSVTDGQNKWQIRWMAPTPGPVQYTEPVIGENHVVFAASSNSFNIATLHCVDKKTEKLLWKTRIDSGSTDRKFNTTPVIVNDKVIVVTQDKNHHRHLTAYQLSGGERLWSTRVADDFITRLHAMDGKIYSTASPVVACYNSIDGSIIWQKDFADSKLMATSTFLGDKQLTLARIYPDAYIVYTLQATDGKLLKEVRLQKPLNTSNKEYAINSCVYHNNKLITTNRYGLDSVMVRCYDLSWQALVWEKRYLHDVGVYDVEVFSPLPVNNYLIFPTNTTNLAYDALLYFVDLSGREIKRIPFTADINLTKLAYEENGVIYNQHGTLIKR